MLMVPSQWRSFIVEISWEVLEALSGVQELWVYQGR